MKIIIAMLSVLASFIIVEGCMSCIEVATPEQPNMNVKIEHEIYIKVDKDIEELLKSRRDLF